MSRPLIALALLALAAAPSLVGCSNDSPTATAAQANTPARPDPAKEAAAMTMPLSEDLNTFIPAGMKLVDSVRGDLTGNGTQDALLVVSAPTAAGAQLGQGSPRSVLLLTDTGGGKLQLAARNDRLVPCERCGGMAGDPYAFSQIEAGSFTVSVSGGSRERWASDYRFTHHAGDNRWQLQQVTRVITDTESGEQREQQLDAGTLGAHDFDTFDPATLPAAPRLDPPAQ